MTSLTVALDAKWTFKMWHWRAFVQRSKWLIPAFGRGSLLNRPSCPPDDPTGRGTELSWVSPCLQRVWLWQVGQSCMSWCASIGLVLQKYKAECPVQNVHGGHVAKSVIPSPQLHRSHAEKASGYEHDLLRENGRCLSFREVWVSVKKRDATLRSLLASLWKLDFAAVDWVFLN